MTPILALDLSTHTGWALRDEHGALSSGVYELPKKRGESPGMRFLRFRGWLRDLVKLGSPRVVAYEQAHHRGGPATALCVGLATEVQAEAARSGAELATVHTATLKKHATGSGRAGKPAMIEAARERWGVEPEDDNEADALLVLAWVLEEIGEGA